MSLWKSSLTRRNYWNAGGDAGAQAKDADQSLLVGYQGRQVAEASCSVGNDSHLPVRTSLHHRSHQLHCMRIKRMNDNCLRCIRWLYIFSLSVLTSIEHLCSHIFWSTWFRLIDWLVDKLIFRHVLSPKPILHCRLRQANNKLQRMAWRRPSSDHLLTSTVC